MARNGEYACIRGRNFRLEVPAQDPSLLIVDEAGGIVVAHISLANASYVFPRIPRLA